MYLFILAPTDYESVINTTLTFQMEERVQCVAIEVVDNTEFLGDRTFSVVLNALQDDRAVILGTPSLTTVTIEDDREC